MRLPAAALSRGLMPHLRAAAVLGVALSMALVPVTLARVPALADPEADKFAREMEQLETEQQHVRAEADRLEAEQAKARSEQQRLETQLQAATDRLSELEAELAALTDQAERTARDVATLTDQQRRQRAQLGERARALYELGGVDPMLMMLGGSSTESMTDTTHFVAALSNKDQTTLEAYSATATRLNRRQADLDDDLRDVTALQAEVADARDELEARMAEAVAAQEHLATLEEQAKANLAQLEDEEQTRRTQEQERLAEIERKRREEAARKAAEEAARRRAAAQAAAREAAREAARAEAAEKARTADRASRSGLFTAATSTSGKVCPQGRPRSFSNDWGAPRSGGRRHQGTDIFGRMSGDVYAITSGTVQFTKVGTTAGLFLSLRGDDGNVYWYMHLASFGARPGQRVSAGQRIGSNGDTGNAKGTPPHIHFEYHPGGGGPTNPYPLLRSIC